MESDGTGTGMVDGSVEPNSSDLLVCQLLLCCGLLRDGLQAPSAPGLRRTGGAAHRASFTQVTGERSVVDLLQVLLDFQPGVFQQVRLTLRTETETLSFYSSEVTKTSSRCQTLDVDNI